MPHPLKRMAWFWVLLKSCLAKLLKLENYTVLSVSGRAERGLISSVCVCALWAQHMAVAFSLSCLHLLCVIKWDCVHGCWCSVSVCVCACVLFPLFCGCGLPVHSVFTSALSVVFFGVLTALPPWLPHTHCEPTCFHPTVRPLFKGALFKMSQKIRFQMDPFSSKKIFMEKLERLFHELLNPG